MSSRYCGSSSIVTIQVRSLSPLTTAPPRAASQSGVVIAISSLRKRLVLGFRQEWQHRQTNQEHRAHRDAGVSERPGMLKAGIDLARQQAESRGANGRHEPADVVAERRAGRSQPGREEFREIDGIAAKEG